MVVIARQPVLAPRIPWRSISFAILLIAILLAAVVAFIGSQPRVPAPFGPAANGLIAYEADGDIFAADAVTGVATAVVTGPDVDAGPRWSPDGTHVVFAREVQGGRVLLTVARSDGSDLTVITPKPIELTESLLGEPWEPYEFSPDGRSVVFAAVERGLPTISIAQSDGSGVRALPVDMAAYEPSFRPPNGAEILFVGEDANEQTWHGMFAIDLSTGDVRTVVAPSPAFDLAGATWSPDGSKIAFWAWAGSEGITAHTHVISADGTGDRELPSPPTAAWSIGSEWSNDGTRLLIVRGYTSGLGDVRAVVIPVEGDSSGVEIRVPDLVGGECCAAWEWSPDDSLILATPTDARGQRQQQLIVDPSTGEVHPAPWSATSDPTWQRLAP